MKPQEKKLSGTAGEEELAPQTRGPGKETLHARKEIPSSRRFRKKKMIFLAVPGTGLFRRVCTQ